MHIILPYDHPMEHRMDPFRLSSFIFRFSSSPSCTSPSSRLRVPSVAILIALALLTGCANLDSEGLPENMPIRSDKLSALRKNMTYAEFQVAFGDGWLSPSANSEAKYWFFDDGRTLVVPPECWKVPSQPLQYRFIGLTAAAPQLSIPILASPKEELKISTQPKP